MPSLQFLKNSKIVPIKYVAKVIRIEYLMKTSISFLRSIVFDSLRTSIRTHANVLVFSRSLRFFIFYIIPWGSFLQKKIPQTSWGGS